MPTPTPSPVPGISRPTPAAPDTSSSLHPNTLTVCRGRFQNASNVQVSLKVTALRALVGKTLGHGTDCLGLYWVCLRKHGSVHLLSVLVAVAKMISLVGW